MSSLQQYQNQNQKQQYIRKSTRARKLSEKAKTNTPTLVDNPQQQQHIINDNDNNNTNDDDESPKKKRKISRIEEEESQKTDKIDPVEKLLSLSNINQDFLSDFEFNTHHHKSSNCSLDGCDNDGDISEQESQLSYDENDDEYYEEDYPVEIENVNFTKIIQDNIRQFYVKRRLQGQYKDTFSLLNKSKDDEFTPTYQSSTQHQTVQQQQQSNNKSNEVPFFKSVNFGNKPKEYTIDDYFSYGDEDDEDDKDEQESGSLSESSSRNSLSVSSEEEYSDSDESDGNGVSPITTPKTEIKSLYIPKINPHHYYYYHGGRFNNSNQSPLFQHQSSLNNSNGNNELEQDLSKILNKNSLINGKASEMVSSGNFLINDFFL
ncbi:predicted protein [Candida tropicalis MYA-3404]|uniref:Uncharacterized protein n=1 Tax=Candida tropicalis (strain ATCC MYA-3404 / T1) TaxID=294747 RepID=C5MHB4_CANTT|nr:predicted protein [Candida tropicalis MYA-3404]EER31016.1 predicted protein [Candida tropicalis MYA-3404]KAG4404576.1 hypothetical protein JTP64_006329 [Candida tropicalis]